MMNGRQKLYFLLDAIDDARAIAPTGRPLIIDPFNDLNDKIRDVELSQLFAKLENDEHVLRVVKPASETMSVIDELDPYNDVDDRYWHFELLPTFDHYFQIVQQEPGYQEFSGRKPKNSQPAKPSNGSIMTYEEKLDRIIKALIEARKATRQNQSTILYLNANNGLECMEPDEIKNILLKLEEENIMTVHSVANRLLPPNQQPKNPGYIYVDILDEFDDWLDARLLAQKSVLVNLDRINLLKIYDVCLDIDQQLQISGSSGITIPSFPYPYTSRFRELFPFDSIGTRQTYMQHRWEGAQYLLKQSVVKKAEYEDGGSMGYGSIELVVNIAKFDEYFRQVKSEFNKRKMNDPSDDEPQPTPSSSSNKIKKETVWSDDFRWEGKYFVFGQYGKMDFSSDDRIRMFKALTDKKGHWATINDLKGVKDAAYVRATLKQIEARLPADAKEHIQIISTQDDEDDIEKPTCGAYRIRVTP